MDEYSSTIVGGRGSFRATRQKYPRGIEILIKKAKADPAFREALLGDPLSAADSIELKLGESERMILRHTPASTLRTMIDNTSIPPRMRPVYRAARTAASLAAIVALSTAAPMIAASAGEMEAPTDVEAATETVQEQMAMVQETLELYREEHGAYPTSEQWLAGNPLEDYLDNWVRFDPWDDLLRYEGVVVDGVVVNYLLACGAGTPGWPDDDIPCPLDPELHSFPPHEGEA